MAPRSFVVPEALAKDVDPRRSVPSTLVVTSEASAKRMLAKIQKQLVKPTHFYERRSYRTIFENGLAKAGEPKLGPLRQSALALIADPTVDAVRAASIEALAAADHYVSCVDRDLDWLDAIAGVRGPLDALRVAHRTADFVPTAGEGGWTTAIWIVSGSLGEHRALPARRWHSVRRAVCASDAKTYASLLKEATALRRGLDLGRRARIAYAFPDEPWADDDLRAWLKVPKKRAHGDPSYTYLLSAAHDVAVVRDVLAREGVTTVSRYALDLAQVLDEEDLLPMLVAALPELLKKPKYGPLLKTPPRVVAQVIAGYRSPAAAEALAPHASHAVLAPIVLGFFRDHPALAHAARGKGKSAAIERVVAKKEPPGGEAAKTGEAPAVLRDRRWRSDSGKREAVSAPPMLGTDEAKVVLTRRAEPLGYDVRDMTKAELAKWRRETRESLAKQEYCVADYDLVRDKKNRFVYLRVPAKDCIDAWNAGAYARATPLSIVAEHGLAVVPGFLKRDWIRWLGMSEDDGSDFYAAASLVTPPIAPRIAAVAARRKKFRRLAHAWLVQNARIAAFGLIPAAIGPLGEARTEAEDALLHVARRGEASAITRVAALYGKDAKRIVATLLARDPLALGLAPPKPPAFLREGALPAVALANGRVLDADARAALLEMLRITPLDPAYPGVALVREACRSDSLAAFAAELLEQWVLGDAPGRHEWMAFATVHFPSEAATRRIGALARDWARRDRAKAARACVVLAALASDLALFHLAHVAETTRYDALRSDAKALLEEAAEARGLSVDELGDRTVPDVGLDREGALVLSYGKRTFTVRLDETLRAVVRDGDGTTLPTLPRATKTDDAALAKAARERFDALKKDLEAVADRQRRRLERAMNDGRTWSLDEFRARFVEHPLFAGLSQRLVWAAASKKKSGDVLFRVAEDRSFADGGDRAVTIPVDATIRIAHPVRDPALTRTWARIFEDYEILQPFDQLGRATHAIAAGEEKATTLERLAGIRAPAKKILGVLESRGFRRESAGAVGAFLRPAKTKDGAALVLRVALHPEIGIELMDGSETTTTAPSIDGPDGEPAAFGALDPVCFSELVRDVEALRALS